MSEPNNYIYYTVDIWTRLPSLIRTNNSETTADSQDGKTLLIRLLSKHLHIHIHVFCMEQMWQQIAGYISGTLVCFVPFALYCLKTKLLFILNVILNYTVFSYYQLIPNNYFLCFKTFNDIANMSVYHECFMNYTHYGNEY